MAPRQGYPKSQHLAVVVSLVLTGCIGTGGIQPHSKLIDASRISPDVATASTPTDGTWPAIDWWKHWHDDQLGQLVRQALTEQPSLRIAKARLDLALAQARIAGASTLPQADLDGAFGLQRYPAYATPRPPGGYTVWSNHVGATLSYDLDL
jgi:outer membrane protein TolC